MLRDVLGLGQNLANKLDHGLPMVCVHRTDICLNTFSINIHHNQPKKLLLSFLSRGTLTVSSKTRFRNGQIGQKSKIYPFHGLFSKKTILNTKKGL